MTVMRSIWINDSGEPFEEKFSEEIEKAHTQLFKDQIANENDCLSMEINESSVDGDSKPTRTERNSCFYSPQIFKLSKNQRLTNLVFFFFFTKL